MRHSERKSKEKTKGMLLIAQRAKRFTGSLNWCIKVEAASKKRKCCDTFERNDLLREGNRLGRCNKPVDLLETLLSIVLDSTADIEYGYLALQTAQGCHDTLDI